jgi:hypothetical protein
MTALAPIRPWHGVFEPLWWAAGALRKELLDFRFEYPVEVIPAAGAKASLHYYVYSDRLFFDAMEPDADGIPIQRSRQFHTYNPAYIAWYGLMSMERSLREEVSVQAIALQQARWLRDHAVERADGAVVWPYTVDWDEGACRLKAPWISAMAQGLAISLLVRAYRITNDPELLRQCRGAARVFELAVANGGVRTVEKGHVVYEEYPGTPSPRVLDGYLFSLLGLYDLATETDDPTIRRLFAEGIDGLLHTLPVWDYKGKWSWYGSHGYLCPPQYHNLNCVLLASLASLTGKPTLQRYADAWTPAHLTAWGRAEVFLLFMLTKNGSRLRHLVRRRAREQRA